MQSKTFQKCFVFILRIRAYSSWKSKINISKYYNIYIWVSINDHPYRIHSGYLVFFETRIMGKTADLAMIQKTIIDTLHKEGKSQRVITEMGGCSRSALSKHIKSKVDEGRNWIGKGAQATVVYSIRTVFSASLRIRSSKADSNTWESFTRSELKLESVHQESPRSDIFSERATKPLLKQKHHQKLLTWAKEKKNDCCSVVQSPIFRWK